jgi:hypothetical protein
MERSASTAAQAAMAAAAVSVGLVSVARSLCLRQMRWFRSALRAFQLKVLAARLAPAQTVATAQMAKLAEPVATAATADWAGLVPKEQVDWRAQALAPVGAADVVVLEAMAALAVTVEPVAMAVRAATVASAASVARESEDQ